MEPQPKPAEPYSPWDWLAVAALLGVVALGIWAIYRVKRWREETAQEEAPAPTEQIEHYQNLLDKGLLDAEEFARIKSRLDAQPGSEALKPVPPPALPNQPPDTSTQEK